MTSHNDGPGAKPPADEKHAAKATPAADTPEWAGGLRQLYDSVVEEDIPDSFKDLLAQLDSDPK